MIDHLYNLVMESIQQNQLLSGGLVLGSMGAALAYGRRIPKLLWNSFIRHFTISLTVNSDAEAFAWVMQWFDSHPWAAKARRIQIEHTGIWSAGGILPQWPKFSSSY